MIRLLTIPMLALLVGGQVKAQKGFTMLSPSIVTVQGNIEHHISDAIYIRYIKDFVTFDTITADSTTVSKRGNFELSFNWTEPAAAFLVYGNHTMPLFLSPGDNLMLNFIGREFKKTMDYCQGENQANNYLKIKNLEENRQAALQSRDKFPDSRSFRHFADSMMQDELSLLESHVDQFEHWTPGVEAFVDYERAQIKFFWINEKLNYRLEEIISEQDEVVAREDRKYYSFLSDVAINDPTATASPSYYIFLDSYINFLRRRLVASKPNFNSLSSERVDYEIIGNELVDRHRSVMLARTVLSSFGEADRTSADMLLTRFKEEETGSPELVKILDVAYQRSLDRKTSGEPRSDTATSGL
ncbi:MAG: hypothetical protein WD077_11525 [Bacteroidia bacterium]